MPSKKLRHTDLLAWQKAMDLAVECYRLSACLPTSEKYGLIGQIRSAAVSVPSNIAEGHGRTGIPEYLHFLSIARGSLSELDTQCRLVVRLDLLKRDSVLPVMQLVEETSRMVGGLIRSLRGTT